jgi:hypothetical protein
MAITQEELDEASIAFCMPVTLLINFSLFQYLLTLYYKRRREYHGFLLLLCATLSFATLIPFASAKKMIAGHLNDVSETASTTTFLVQITIVSRDVTKKMRIRILRYMMLVSELLTILQLFVLVINFIEVAMPEEGLTEFDGLDNIAEDLALFFIFISRFYYLYIARGWRYLLDNKKLEIFTYTLFLTHEYPFTILEAETGLNWEPVQSLWNRLTLALCISLTIKEKFRSSMLSNSNTKLKTTSHDAQFSEYDTKGNKGVSNVRSAVMSRISSAKMRTASGPSHKNVFAIRASFSKTVHPVQGTSQRSLASFNRVGGSPGAVDKSMTHLQVGALG